MFTGMEMMACQNLAVPAEVMQHIVNVESANNPYAIGVVGAHLVRQPRSLGEAVATARMLEGNGYNFSLGLAQLSRANLGRLGLDSYEAAFAPCPNLAAGSRILAQCYASSGGDWGKSFSCYYSGNFATGYRDGCVQKVYASIGRSAHAVHADVVGANIPLPPIPSPPDARGLSAATPPAPGSAAHRIAIRSVRLDTALLAPRVTAVVSAPAATTRQQLGTTSAESTSTNQDGAIAVPLVPDADAGVFEPKVSGPADRAATAPIVASHAVDQADLRQGTSDDAFVF